MRQKRIPCLKAWIKKESPDKMRERERRSQMKPKWKYCGIQERRRELGEEMPGYIWENTEGDCAAQHIINYTQSSAWEINETHSICTYSTITAQTPSDPDTAFFSQCKHRSWCNPFSWGQTLKSLYDHVITEKEINSRDCAICLADFISQYIASNNCLHFKNVPF